MLLSGILPETFASRLDSGRYDGGDSGGKISPRFQMIYAKSHLGVYLMMCYYCFLSHGITAVLLFHPFRVPGQKYWGFCQAKIASEGARVSLN